MRVRLSAALFVLLALSASAQEGPRPLSDFVRVIEQPGVGEVLECSIREYTGPKPDAKVGQRMFGGMGALLALRSKPAGRWEIFAWCVGFSAFAESLQAFSPNRHPSPWDALLNITAALAFYQLSARASGRGSRPGS